MTKRLAIDEASRIPHYERVIVVYQCGCSFYNDKWLSACESDAVCPEHHKPVKAESCESVGGFRPEVAETKRHTLKIN